MKNHSLLTRILTVVGTILVWVPLVVPVVLSLVGSLTRGRFLFDYLMPAELFLFALVGGLMLVWVAIWVHTGRGLIGWGLGLAVGLLVGSQVLAVVTGLANGDTEPGGWQWALVLTMLVGYFLALVVIGMGGVKLWQIVWKREWPRSLHV
ncbi:MAG: hypothetical protein H6636_08765 [Anaerolineales bacterium]|nr:hypothetical protein [Anaerolineales bacterium]